MRKHVLWMAVLLVAALTWFNKHHAGAPSAGGTVQTAAAAPANPLEVPPPLQAATAPNDTSLPAFLPPEARTTLDLIARGGPFPHRQDGVVFQNREHRLPSAAQGYYHEYTVDTPGAHDRGTRRIITGGTPPRAYWYTDDHYQTFRPIPAKAGDPNGAAP